MADNTEIVEQKETKPFSVTLAEKLNEVSDALPTDFNKARFVQNSLALINDNKDLQKYKPSQIMSGLLKGSFLGCDFYAKECWLIPYGSDLQFQLSYKGAVKLAKKYSTRPIKEIYAKVVRQGDEFKESIVDGEPHIEFNPMPFNGGSIIGAFAICLYEDSGLVYETMSIADIEKAKAMNRANSPAWKSFPDEMAKKVVLKRLTKHLDLDMENPTQLKAYQDDMVAVEEPTPEVVNAFDDAVETTATEVE